ncbi:SLC13 family permease [Leptolyngbyaceae cyanobacterium CCMR0082]|uniref:SLC13 family permease n=2 Tax=Adonisia turfae TaxID=2950184 RepID=A0A6M0SFS0_9CYAN|nr:SLC13 family permease [Adonisia turfae]MDV3352610.1 SLC13 family permease [Leptothoe sp. LEGE 181152]NEZ59103.1 SLC13 family permease [Adonisia turfae CCMR0081]NEZ67358.1 SLC13 family permease [Adonisia turfae CCMR0082]
MTIDIQILMTLGVTAVALLLFIVEWLPADITALGVMVALMVLGLVSPQEGIAGFSNSATITVMAMFILSAGIARTGALQQASNWLIQWGGKTCRRQIFALGLIVGPISGLINNTAVVSVFLPIIEDFCQQHRISPSKLLMPLSFATILGGMLTVVGTSTSVLASGLSDQLGYGEFSLFQFVELGAVIFVVGLLYLTFIAPFLLPNRDVSGNSLSQEYGLKEYVSEVVVTPRSSLVGQTLQSSQLQRRFDLDVLEIIRNDNHFPQPLGDKSLCAGDILLVRARQHDLLKIRDGEGIEILPDVQFGQKSWQADLSSGQEGVAEALVIANSNLVGSTLKELRFRQRYNVTVLAIRRGQDLVRERMGKVRLKFGDLLLVQGPKQSLLGLQTSRDLLVLEQRDLESLRSDRANLAMGIGVGVVAVAAFTPINILVSALAGVMLMILTGCLKPGELYQAVRWDVIFLLACLIPLGTAMESSGATALLAQQLISIGGSLSGYGLLSALYVLTTVLSSILSNSAAVILLLPVGLRVASELGLNVFTVMFVITFAASNSFMTPIGYQTNTMVYTAGGYRFLDFVRVGGPLSLLLALVTPPLAIWLYGI